MYKSKLVSILMPVYNSYGHVRSEGKDLLTIALNSLLSQTYTNIELIILDNQSSDQTPTICKDYAIKDKRIRYIRDNKKRFPEGAITKLASYAKGEFCMIANDDDQWDKNYIKTLIEVFSSNPKIDLCYSNGHYIDIDGNINNRFNDDKHYLYDFLNTTIYNTSKYLYYRNVIPIAFGLYRTKAFVETLPFKKFDELKANVDNLFMATFIISGRVIKHVDQDLFYYRVKTRALDPAKVSGMPSLSYPFDVWLYYSIHQFTFSTELIKIIDKYAINNKTRELLTAHAINSCMSHIINLIQWIANEVAKSKRNRKELYSCLSSLSSDQINYDYFPTYLGTLENTYQYESATYQLFLQQIQFRLSNLKQTIYNNKSKSSHLDLHRKLLTLIKARQIIISRILKNSGYNDKKVKMTIPTKIFKPNKPKISIIITSYNLKPFLRDTMYSVLNQTSNSYEVIIVDGNSSDGSIKMIKQLAAKYPQIKYISEKDSGYPDAFWKGLKMAKGDYIAQCAVSDLYTNKKWLELCTKALDSDETISLIWGLPQSISENGFIKNVSYPQFHQSIAPTKKNYFLYWLKSGFYFPEGNLIARKNVVLRCYPELDEIDNNTLDWLEFSYRFNVQGYLSSYLPIIANYGREHSSQMGIRLTKNGVLESMNNHYKKKVKSYLLKIIFRIKKHHFADSNGKEISSVYLNKSDIIDLRQSVYHKELKHLMNIVYTKVRLLNKTFFNK